METSVHVCKSYYDFSQCFDSEINDWFRQKQSETVSKRVLCFLVRNQEWLFQKEEKFFKSVSLLRNWFLSRNSLQLTEQQNNLREKVECIFSYLPFQFMGQMALELNEHILTQLPAKTRQDVFESYQTIQSYCRENGYDESAMSRLTAVWINLHHIPLVRFKFSIEQTKKLGPWLTYLNMDGYVWADAVISKEFRESFPTLKHLRLSALAITTLPPLPDNLETLRLHRCQKLCDLGTSLPKGLTDLVVHSGKSLRQMTVPDRLEFLSVENCERLEKLPDIVSESLIELNIRKCPRIRTLPKRISESIQKLVIKDCRLFSDLPPTLPQKLIWLELEQLENLLTLPDSFPPSLKKCLMFWCPQIKRLPNSLPDSMEILYIKGSDSLDFWPKQWPRSLKHLILGCCPKINPPTDLPEKCKLLSWG